VALACGTAAGPALAAGFTKVRTAAGPSPNVISLGGASLARDGSGAVAFLQRDLGAPHVFLARMRGRRPTAPVRVDVGQSGPSSSVRVAVADGGESVVTWINGGQLYASVEPSTGAGFAPPTALCLCGQVSDPSLDVSRFGTAYLTFTAPGRGGHDVRVAVFDEGSWTVVSSPVDVHATRDAFGARVAASSDGTGIAAFVERPPGGAPTVYERRLLRTELSQAPRRASLGRLSGRRGGAADTPSVDIQDDSSYAWVAFRQDFIDGSKPRSRVLAHRLAGSRFDRTSQIDGLGFPARREARHALVSLSGRGYGMAVTNVAPNTLVADVLTRHRTRLEPTFEKPVRVQGRQPSAEIAVVSSDDSSHGVAAWQRTGGGRRRIVARYFDGTRFEKAVEISHSGAGPTHAELGLDSEADDAEDHLIAFVQGGPSKRRIQVVMYAAPR
jgi:hypothetical protein